jgi:hypothetical protein
MRSIVPSLDVLFARISALAYHMPELPQMPVQTPTVGLLRDN